MFNGELCRTFRKLHFKLEQSSFPYCLVLPRNRAVPSFEVERALWGLHRSCYETERVVFAPLFAAKLLASLTRKCLAYAPGESRTALLAVELALETSCALARVVTRIFVVPSLRD